MQDIYKKKPTTTTKKKKLENELGKKADKRGMIRQNCAQGAKGQSGRWTARS